MDTSSPYRLALSFRADGYYNIAHFIGLYGNQELSTPFTFVVLQDGKHIASDVVENVYRYFCAVAYSVEASGRCVHEALSLYDDMCGDIIREANPGQPRWLQ